MTPETITLIAILVVVVVTLYRGPTEKVILKGDGTEIVEKNTLGKFIFGGIVGILVAVVGIFGFFAAGGQVIMNGTPVGPGYEITIPHPRFWDFTTFVIVAPSGQVAFGTPIGIGSRSYNSIAVGNGSDPCDVSSSYGYRSGVSNQADGDRSGRGGDANPPPSGSNAIPPPSARNGLDANPPADTPSEIKPLQNSSTTGLPPSSSGGNSLPPPQFSGTTPFFNGVSSPCANTTTGPLQNSVPGGFSNSVSRAIYPPASGAIYPPSNN